MQNNKQSPHISELLNKAVRHHQCGELDQAESLYKEILESDPGHPIASHLLGVVAHQSGKHDVAIKLMKKAIEANTEQSFRFLVELGNVYKNLGEFENAARCFQDSIALRPDYAEACYGMATIHKLQDKVDDAASCYTKALELNLGSVEAHIEMGDYFEANDRIELAISSYQKIIQSESVNTAMVNMKLGILHGALGDYSRAIVYFQKANELMPESASANYNLGLAFQKLGILDKAISAYLKNLEIDPENADAYINMGAMCQKQGDLDAALGHYRKANQLRPEDALICSNLSLVLRKQNKFDEATQWFEKSLSLDPDHADYLSNYICHLKDTCDWGKLGELSAKLDAGILKAIAAGARAPETPLINLTRQVDLALNFAVAKSWVDDITRQISSTDKCFSYENRRKNTEKITIGYLSNNFGNHPVAHLMQNLYRLHDRNSFEVNCYSYGRDDGSHYRKKIEQDCDNFIDIFQSDHFESARCINEDQVDILVDLVGHTEDNRMIICAYRPAPLQVSYLGFPGASGADFMDYIITDRIVTPECDAPFYSEKFAYMPDSYQINEKAAAIPKGRMKKQDFALPENNFIFCALNRAYKIDPDMFDSWMRILREVDQSVLWLLSGGETAERNLRKVATLRGVDPERLVFAGMLPMGEHLQRLQLADLALDTRIYNGGATSSRALKAAIPLITLRGGHFLSRMSASSLMAAGLPELITSSLEEYEALAVRLARDPVELESIKLKLEGNILTAPIFNTAQFVRNLESTYRKIWEIHLSGENTRQIN